MMESSDILVDGQSSAIRANIISFQIFLVYNRFFVQRKVVVLVEDIGILSRKYLAKFFKNFREKRILSE